MNSPIKEPINILLLLFRIFIVLISSVKILFSSVDIIGLKKYRINTGMFSYFYPILMYIVLLDSLNNFISNCQEEISKIFDDSKTIYNSL